MCGIIGYVGSRSALPILFDGLKKLEYRGYDSAGIAFRNGKGIEIFRTKGKIGELQQLVPHSFPEAVIGIGHTRWATHGEPSSANAHPHRSNGVVVVHNGIIENYRSLKSELMASGRTFTSETDTEVIPHLISDGMDRGLSLSESIEEAVRRLEGTYALGIMCEKQPESLIVVKKGSPLVIGYGVGEYFFASDISALLPYTKKYVFLEDGQICILRNNEVDIRFLGSPETIDPRSALVEIAWSSSVAEKNGYDHFMLKEIHEQPAAVQDTVREWSQCSEKIAEEINLSVKTAFGLRGLHMAACGTSYHAGLAGRYMIESLAHFPVAVDIASEYRYMPHMKEHDKLYLFITQSGETADTLAALRDVKARGLRTLAICNVVGSSASREADCVLYTRAGPEIGVAATKTFSSQIAALFLLATILGLKKGMLHSKEVQTLQSQILRIPELMGRVMSDDNKIREIAEVLAGARDVLYLARGINYPLALEGALKLKEISYIHAEGYPAGEMKHGPIALIEKGSPVIVIAPVDIHFEKIFSNVEEVRARGARVFVITDGAEYFKNKAEGVIEVPPSHPLLSPFLSVIPLQLLAYYAGVFRGYDVDQPRNLAKSVTVE